MRSSGHGSSRSPAATGTMSSRTGRTFCLILDRHTRHQKRSRAELRRSSQPRRSKCHQRQCGSKRALWPHLQTGMTDCLNVAASRMQVGTITPSRDHCITHSGNRSWFSQGKDASASRSRIDRASCRAASSRIRAVGAHSPTRAQPGADSKASATAISSNRVMNELEHFGKPESPRRLTRALTRSC